MKYTNLISSLIFVLVIMLLYVQWEKIIQVKRDEDHGQFFHEKNIDIVFIGTSRTWIAFSPMHVWNKYGVVSYNRGSSGQSYRMSYVLMKDAVNKHNAKVIVLDISYLVRLGNPSISNMSNILNMLPLTERYSAYKEIYGKNYNFKHMNIANRFHTRWKELNKNDFTYSEYWKGLVGTFNYPFMTYIGHVDIPYAKVTLDPDVIKYAKLFQKYADEHGINLIFINIPQIKLNHAYAEEFSKIAEKENLLYFNYATMTEEINFDYKSDLSDPYHTNIKGGEKILNHLIPYIMEHYNIQNRRNEPQYALWNEDYIKYARAVNREEIRVITSFKEWYSLIYYDNYSIFIATNGDNILNKLPQEMKDKFNILGLNKYETDKTHQHYAAIIDDGDVFFEEISSNSVEYKGRMKNIVNILVSSKNNNATINISGKPKSKNQNGINFVVYDKVNREVVDSIWIDPNEPDKVRR